MDEQGYGRIPPVLCSWITCLCHRFPARSIKTFIELLTGSMLSSSGHVCQAILRIDYGRDWTSYYWWLRHGQWSWMALAKQMAGLVIRWCDEPIWHLIIDDTLVLRASKKAPGVAKHREHNHKPNQADYVRAQCWVTLAVSVGCAAIPLLSRLVGPGNPGKLKAARALLRVMAGYFRPARLLLDCWYMRGWLIEEALAMGLEVIGQVRVDTALFARPGHTGKRGRPRKYGDRIDFEGLPEQRMWLRLYGEERWVRWRCCIACPRFLGGRPVAVVWTRFERSEGRMTAPRLILSTETQLSGEAILLAYAKRWAIEPMFNDLKNRWGVKQCWQQHRQTLCRWVQIQSVAYALIRLLTLQDGNLAQQLAEVFEWRRGQPVTAGQARQGLEWILRGINVRQWWDAKSRKFGPPERAGPVAKTAERRLAA